jgi:hypothetical protein
MKRQRDDPYEVRGPAGPLFERQQSPAAEAPLLGWTATGHDKPTSTEALRSAPTGTIKARALAAISEAGAHGATRWEVVQRTGILWQSMGGAVVALLKAAEVVEGPDRRVGPTGREGFVLRGRRFATAGSLGPVRRQKGRADVD